MWTFVEVARVERAWQRWAALVTLQRGGVRESFWLGFGTTEPTAQQVDAAAAAAVVRMNAAGAQDELDDMVDREDFAAPAFQTGVQLAQRFRATYQGANAATAATAARMAYWLIERIVVGDFTDTQVRSAFGLTAPQYTNLKARFQALHDHWLAIKIATGE